MRARAIARAEQAARQTRRRAPGMGGDGPRKDRGVGVGAASARAGQQRLSLRVSAAGLSLAVGGDRGRGRGNGGSLHRPFRGHCSEPLPWWAHEEGINIGSNAQLGEGGRPAVSGRGSLVFRGPASA